MKFEEALKELRKGKKIRRATWSVDNYIFMNDCGDFEACWCGGTVMPLRYLQAEDWEVIVETHDWDWAVEILRIGKRVRRLGWNPSKKFIYTEPNNNYVMLCTQHGCAPYKFRGNEFTSADWVEVP